MNLLELNPFDFYYVLFVIFVFGACIGSFTNVVILRAFTGESIVLPPSKCPNCKNKLKWYHNIPILSYLFLRGKCGFCKKKISIQYPLVEATVALLFIAIFLKFNLTLNAIFLSIIATICVILAVTDIKEQVIFDAHAYILGFIGLVYNFFDIGKSNLGTYELNIFANTLSINKSFIYALLGILAGAVIMEALAGIGKLLVGKRAFGEGDSFILGALGGVFKIQAIPSILILGIVVQIVLILPMFIKSLINKKEYKLLIGLSGFTASVALFKLLEYFDLLKNLLIFCGAFLLMMLFAIYSCKKLLKSAKNGDGLTYVPFGPPLVIAALLLLFI